MAYSYVDLIASAGQQNFPFSIPYLDRDHISVFQNGVLVVTADWTFLLAQVIRLDVGAAENDVVRVKRVTPIDEPIVDYHNGSVLGESQLDATALQSLFFAQEISDAQDGNIHQNDNLQWDALGLPIINLGAGVDATDAGQKGQFESLVTDAEAARDLAQGYASTASTAATNAATAKNAAELAETHAETAETNAETAETNAEISADAAQTSAGNAVVSEAAAAASAATASTQASNAATSASAASTSASSAAVQKALAEAEANAAEASAIASAASAADAALSAAKLRGTSVSSVAIGVGSKSFTTQTGKFFDAGMWLLITSGADPTNYFHGYSTSYVGAGLTVMVTNIGGSGTFADWTIRVSGTQGAIGTPGAGSSIAFAAEGADIATRPKVNFIEGTNVSLTVADNGGATRVDVTINADDQIAAHVAAGDPHTQYMTSAEVDTSIAVHAAAADPHTGYQKESEKDAASGYAGLTAGAKIQDNAVVSLSITDAAVTKAKMENADADSLIGRGNGGGAGVPQKIILGTNLSMSGTTLNAAGGSGDSLIYEFW